LPQICLYTKIINTVALKVKRNETILNLKALLSEKAGISENLQELFFVGNRLMNDRRLVDYGIQQGSTVHLFVQNVFGLRVNVKTPSDKKIIAIEVRSFDTIQNIKSIIQAKEGIQSDQYSVVHNGKVLEDDRILSSLNIPNDTTLHLVFNPKDVLSVFLKTVAGEILKLEVKVLFTIRDVKTIVESMTGVLNFDWDLFYGGKKLEDCKSLASYDIKEETILEMLPALFQILVKVRNRRKAISIDVKPRTTINDVKSKIFEGWTGALDDDWYLICAGKQLEGCRTLASYDIKEEALLEMSSTSFPIFVSLWNGETFKFLVQQCKTIRDFKNELSFRVGFPVRRLDILFNGKRLEDSRDLVSYGVWKDSTIDIVLLPIVNHSGS
jgi:ubiquitin C